MNRGVLLAAAGLHMATQSALAPFYPELFRSAYGVTSLTATGGFLILCQLACMVALPLWGRATRRAPLARLVTLGQGAAVLLAASLALAPTYTIFTILSVLLIAAKSVVLLAYPSIARSHPRGLRPGIVQYVAVLHGASIAATFLGTVVVSFPEPRLALPILAVAELALLGAVLPALRRKSAAADPAVGSNSATAVGAGRAAVPAVPAVGSRSAGRVGSPLLERSRELGEGWAQRHGAECANGLPTATPSPGASPSTWALAPLAAFVLLYAVAVYAVRPYFTEYATANGTSTQEAALLFVLPHIAVLATLPFANALRRRFGSALLPTALVLGAASLAWQAATPEPTQLAASRILLGAGLALSQVALDERVLSTTGEGSTYSVIATAQTAGLLLAPLTATLTAKADLTAPLITCGALFAALALLSPKLTPTLTPQLPAQLTPNERPHPHDLRAPRTRAPRRLAGVLARGKPAAARQDPVGVRVRGTD